MVSVLLDGHSLFGQQRVLFLMILALDPPHKFLPFHGEVAAIEPYLHHLHFPFPDILRLLFYEAKKKSRNNNSVSEAIASHKVKFSNIL